jgi:hypothetical protein
LVGLQKVNIVTEEALLSDQLERELDLDTIVAESLTEPTGNQNKDCTLDFFKTNCFKFVKLL